MSLIEYPGGGGELCAVVLGHRSEGASSKALHEWRTRIREERELGSEVASQRAQVRAEAQGSRSAAEGARRARSQVRRLCRQYRLRYMVTLTYPGQGVQDYDRSLRYVQDFLHDHGELVHRGSHVWLAVPELHPGGHGWHWHILVRARFSKADLARLRQGWTDFLRRRGMAPSGGAHYSRIDVTEFPNASEAGRYCAKYVGKDFEGQARAKGRKRYLRPRGLDVAVQRGGASSLAEVRAAIAEIAPGYTFESSDSDDWQGPPMVWATW